MGKGKGGKAEGRGPIRERAGADAQDSEYLKRFEPDPATYVNTCTENAQREPLRGVQKNGGGGEEGPSRLNEAEGQRASSGGGGPGQGKCAEADGCSGHIRVQRANGVGVRKPRGGEVERNGKVFG